MDKVIGLIKIVGYFCSIVMPVFDAIKGVKDGMKKAVSDVKYEQECRDIYQFIDDNENIEEVEFELDKGEKK